MFIKLGKSFLNLDGVLRVRFRDRIDDVKALVETTGARRRGFMVRGHEARELRAALEALAVNESEAVSLPS